LGVASSLEAIEQIEHLASVALAVAPLVAERRQDLGLFEPANGAVRRRPGRRGQLHRAGDADDRLAGELVDQRARARAPARVAGASQPVRLDLIDHRGEPPRLAHGRDHDAREVQAPFDRLIASPRAEAADVVVGAGRQGEADRRDYCGRDAGASQNDVDEAPADAAVAVAKGWIVSNWACAAAA
jgi:hypothetical protein